ncbi:TraV family lipoprotein [Aeromonas caviae]|uniref:TraV family lipoprotein n=1 Tax=Aeromonas caviae TaxID=648 RepID=A0AA42R916_AERCA|nr:MULTISPECIES: TraV family lipoprotein [Aeromonas]MDH0436527.1 TraV family lipoprotein [Aeromonas caviae]MDH0477433.1 TraV family lipoprotein [Aeromonas caviae]MDH0939145.1 TraV family lipoprotein [Aeromonas caviae]MDH1400003.1 TraV family lipoprotein [Aeromonas caviae]MDH1505874.1 TraV family lipoprotein [Aeromonas caviae]
MKNFSKTLLLTLMLPLAGCSLIGQSDSSCPGKPGGYVCKGPREVYELTTSKTSLFDGTQDGLDDDDDAKKGSATGKNADASGAVVDIPAVGVIPSNSQSLYRDDMSAPEPMAVRADARILRVQFAAYEDDAGSLNMPGYAYVEVEPKRWLVGAAANKQPAKIIPLQVRQDADGNLAHKQQVSSTVDPLGVRKVVNTPGQVGIPPELLRK